jgi:hypothetical protein
MPWTDENEQEYVDALIRWEDMSSWRLAAWRDLGERRHNAAMRAWRAAGSPSDQVPNTPEPNLLRDEETSAAYQEMNRLAAARASVRCPDCRRHVPHEDHRAGCSVVARPNARTPDGRTLRHIRDRACDVCHCDLCEDERAAREESR